MDIELRQLPMAGQALNFIVEGGIGITNINVYVDSMLVQQHDCDDPPCHEMVMIPSGTRGATLKIVATDSVGNSHRLEYQIVDSDSDASGMMSMEV